MKNSFTKTMSISFKPDLFSQLDNYCSEHGCTRSWLVNNAVKRYLTEYLEDIEDYKSAATAWEEFEKGDKKTYSSAELREEFGL